HGEPFGEVCYLPSGYIAANTFGEVPDDFSTPSVAHSYPKKRAITIEFALLAVVEKIIDDFRHYRSHERCDDHLYDFGWMWIIDVAPFSDVNSTGRYKLMDDPCSLLVKDNDLWVAGACGCVSPEGDTYRALGRVGEMFG